MKRSKLESRFERIDSFGTLLYHVGETPDGRSVDCCYNHGIIVDHHAQKLTTAEFDKFDYLLVMDEDNLRNVMRLRPRGNTRCNVQLFGDYKTDSKFPKIVQDPYYGGDDGFETNYRQIVHFSQVFIKKQVLNS